MSNAKTEEPLVITLTSKTKLHGKATFSWTYTPETSCDIVSFGLSSEELEAILEAKGHEGADVEGYHTEIS